MKPSAPPLPSLFAALACSVLASPFLACPGIASAQAEAPTWFVVAEMEHHHGDSFLLPLTNPDDIAAARLLAAEGADSGVGTIVSVALGRGGDGFNRDVRNGDRPWSWHVAAFNGFADLAIEVCDGWPGFIEADVDAFLANTQSQACLWGYTVVEELEQPPAFPIREGLDGAWFEPGSSGQGVYLDVLAERQELALAWFSFTPPEPGAAPADTQRWWTAHGSFEGDTAVLPLYLTTGGEFDSGAPVHTTEVGTARVRFEDCNAATLHYTFTGAPDAASAPLEGVVHLQRAVPRSGCYSR